MIIDADDLGFLRVAFTEENFLRKIEHLRCLRMLALLEGFPSRVRETARTRALAGLRSGPAAGVLIDDEPSVRITENLLGRVAVVISRISVDDEIVRGEDQKKPSPRRCSRRLVSVPEPGGVFSLG